MTTYAEFLWAQLSTADSRERPLTRHLKQPLWGEILPFDLTAVPPAPPGNKSRSRCVVTPYVGNLFEWIFAEGVEVVDSNTQAPIDDSDTEVDIDVGVTPLLKPSLKVDTTEYTFHHEEYGRVLYPRFTTQISGQVRAGDVVELQKAQGTRWTKSTQKWYAFVTDIWTTPKGDKHLRILWLYWPEDTALCMTMKYPHQSEVCSLCGCD